MDSICSRHAIRLAGVVAGVLFALPGRADTPTPPPGPAPPAPLLAADGALPASGEPARISLDLQDTPAEQVAQRLGVALGCEIRLEGPTAHRVSVKLEGVPVREALERATAAMGATWQRTFVFAVDAGVRYPPALPTGLKVSLNLTDTPCQTAAIICSRAAGGRLEAASELSGRVTLVGKEIPVEEAMEKIAEAAGATWHTLYTFKLSAPTVAPASRSDKSDPKNPGSADPQVPSYERDRFLVGPDGRRRFLNAPKERRTRYNQLGKYGVRLAPRVEPDLKQMEELSRLGSFAGIFSAGSEEERALRVKRFRAALETQAHRLDTFKPDYRQAATGLAKSQLQSILEDAKALDEVQKKEVEPILEFIRKRLQALTKGK